MYWYLSLQVFLVLSVSASYSSSAVVEIQEDDWTKVLEGEWMIEFYAPWCPACRALQPTWNEFGSWDHDLGLDGIASIDVTQAPGLSGRFMVTALPTIYHVKHGEFRQYRGSRDKDSLISFIEEKKWKEVEPVSAWKHPNSVQMSLVSSFFKMSMVLRNVHSTLTEEYGLPSWMSYVLFALATIVAGAMLGLVLVLCIDCAFPASGKGTHRVTQKEKKDSDNEGEDEDDDIPDNDGDKPADKDDTEEDESKEPQQPQNVRHRKAVRRDD